MHHTEKNTAHILSLLLKNMPDAMAYLKGSAAYSNVNGTVSFYQTDRGVFVITSMHGLPQGPGPCGHPVFALHIHAGGSCSGNEQDPFANAGSHYNPHNCLHPYHAGDLSPLFGSGGYAWSGMLTDRFTVEEVIGKTVILHAMPDDFHTQPAGNSGAKIACGVIHA